MCHEKLYLAIATHFVLVVHFREAHGRSHTLQGLPHDGLGGAGLARVVQPHHQQEDLLVLPHAPHLPTLKT